MSPADLASALALPSPVRALVETLVRAGHEVVLVGGCVRDALRGVGVSDFDLATDAAPERVLALFPRAVPTGLRHGTVMVPTSAGPVDITTYRAGGTLEADLAHRDFTLNAMAWDPVRDALIDPFEGARDLEARRLRAVGSARDRFAEDPLRALRAVRLVASLGLTLDPDLEAAIAEARPALAGRARERVRAELERILLSDGVATGLALLRRTGLEADLAPGARDDAPRVAAGLPTDLALRLAAWLRGTQAGRILVGLRFARALSREVEELVRRHPVDASLDPRSDAAVRRLLQRAGCERVEALLALRRAELEAAPEASRGEAGRRLAELRATLERVLAQGALALQRRDLALDGSAVMKILGTGPGPHVGRALAYLSDLVIEDPSRNTEAGLGAALHEWADSRS
jgi:tRNA nucleotidyltransferase (CCA-adding enzyme)